MRIVPAFDELQYSQASFGLGLEGMAVEQLTFERGEKALAERIVKAISDGAHGGAHAGVPTTLAEGQGGVLTTLVGVMDDTFRMALLDRHV